MSLTQRTASGLEHGLINTVSNSVPDTGFKRFDEKFRQSLEKMKKEDEKLVKVRYINSRGANERLERPYMRYEGQPITTWRFIHNHVYTVPKGLIDEVNSQPELAQRSEILDSNGVPTKKDGPGEKLHRFYSAEI